MERQAPLNPPLAAETQKVEKRSYSSPQLRLYGSVRHFTQGSLGAGNDGGIGKKNNQSDRACKTNLAIVGLHPLGIHLYLFDYKAEFPDLAARGRQLGVMADEVEVVMPEAVFTHPDGFKRVDYSMLGLEAIGTRLH